MEHIIKKALKSAGLNAQSDIINRSAFYLKEVWNTGKNLNITGAKSIEELIYKHFLDSVYLLKHYDFRENNLLDLGTGAGFPGVPLKFFCENVSLFLMDSSRRKINFLKYTLSAMQEENVYFLHGRAEEYGHKKEYREKFNVVCSRAVSGLGFLAEWGFPLITPGGVLILYKGPRGEEELQEATDIIRVCGGKKEQSIKYELPGGEKRIIYIFRKYGNTPDQYPRKNINSFAMPAFYCEKS